MAPGNHFDPDTVSLMGRVCDEAWLELQNKVYLATSHDAGDVRIAVASRVLHAVTRGERNPARLRSIALEAIGA